MHARLASCNSVPQSILSYVGTQLRQLQLEFSYMAGSAPVSLAVFPHLQRLVWVRKQGQPTPHCGLCIEVGPFAAAKPGKPPFSCFAYAKRAGLSCCCGLIMGILVPMGLITPAFLNVLKKGLGSSMARCWTRVAAEHPAFLRLKKLLRVDYWGN